MSVLKAFRPSVRRLSLVLPSVLVALIQSGGADLSIFTPDDVYVYAGGAYARAGVDDGDGLSTLFRPHLLLLLPRRHPKSIARLGFHSQAYPFHGDGGGDGGGVAGAPRCCSTSCVSRCRTKSRRYIRFHWNNKWNRKYS